MYRLIWLVFAIGAITSCPAADVDFDSQVRPILSDKCFHCHGPDEATRAADLRLDTVEGATEDRGGYAAVVPGDLENSEALRRVLSDDPDEVMPPPESKLTLSAREKSILQEWIESGAHWSEHWSFVPPQLPTVPEDPSHWSHNEIDRFIRSRALAVGVAPQAEADRETLIRRVSLDLTGLPPSLAEVDAFLADESDGAYERLVDRLLASPRYGERMAWEWLDAARYADTDGFQGDPTRTMWPWRDWLVDALNDNMPFDQFTIEMLAGDLLDHPTPEQILATGFNRNHMFNGEGGRIAEETRVENVFDRAETTGTVWLGLTMTCCRCHDHKFDPISLEEYFQFYAFFDNTSETGRSGRGKTAPVLDYLDEDQRRRRDDLAAELQTVESELTAPLPNLDAEQAVWEVEMRDKLADHTGAALKTDPNDRPPEQRRKLREHFRSKHWPEWKTLSERRDQLKKQLANLEKQAVTVMVMDDLPDDRRRQTLVLERGGYDKPTDVAVDPGTPAALPPLPADAPRNRLTLARWLVDPTNPLTARVTVNRYWQTFFGRGIVESTEDFGLQGNRPTHPDLLDWLAVRFVQSGWNVKQLHKLIVMSATYRQSSNLDEASVERDPQNKWFARAPRYRLPSWMLRDQALAVSGLLTPKIGGPAVKPYQPEGIWAEATFGKIRYTPDSGEKLYRRSLYIFWRRIVGPTMFFDGAKRQTCEVKPTRTNTPLHALTTLNETTFVESARMMAERVLREKQSRSSRLTYAFRLATARKPTKRELDVLESRVEKLRNDFAANPDDALELVSVGQAPRDPEIDLAEHAAYTIVCSILLNLDETLSKH
ncbi:PSD1 and planctomycete cytochrome C domain-containing protein [Stieleria mannarensis]|uniref:PSD1 and planctomycete cytochrome C domain-containing protein n=1 Tax=Stieleria mannarensis TaxID=2755585 RepID=UPI00160190A4|nr:PSD1 and planctomycete cytochrome C domain-containing protein [Rhodopirellula sp. JC639]